MQQNEQRGYQPVAPEQEGQYPSEAWSNILHRSLTSLRSPSSDTDLRRGRLSSSSASILPHFRGCVTASDVLKGVDALGE